MLRNRKQGFKREKALTGVSIKTISYGKLEAKVMRMTAIYIIRRGPLIIIQYWTSMISTFMMMMGISINKTLLSMHR